MWLPWLLVRDRLLHRLLLLLFFLFLMQMSFIAITAISFFSFLLLFVSAKRETRRSRCETVSERRRKREIEEVT